MGVDLRISLLGANIFVPDEQSNLTGIAIDIAIWNTGDEPSIALGWALEIILANGEKVRGRYTAMPDRLVLRGDNRTLLAQDSLDRIAASKQIENVAVNGHVLFYANVQKSRVLNDKTQLKVSAFDKYEKQFYATKAIGDWL